MWSEIQFGRHAGKSIPQVLFSDPDYFFWAWEKDVFPAYNGLHSEAARAHRRATAIIVPERNGVAHVVEYSTDPTMSRLEEVDFVPADGSAHHGASITLRRDHLDMSMPRQLRRYDKGGMKILVWGMKGFYFGDERFRLNRQRAEAFFDDETYFVNP
jgi:hypothetical protein